MVASWWLKLDRAQHHLEDVHRRVGRLSEPGPHSRDVRVEHQGDPDTPFGYFLDLADLVDDVLPAVVGDFLFDVRCALDHVAVACAPRNRQGNAMFPIFTVDPFDRPAREDAQGIAVGRNQNPWIRATKGMSEPVLAYLKSLQPYVVASEDGADPTDHPLAVLGELQNADKHRSLTVLAHGLRDITITVDDGVTVTPMHIAEVPLDRFLRDGTRVVVAEAEVDVQIMGSLAIAVARTPESTHREVPWALDEIMRLSCGVVETLERLAGI